MSHSVVLLESSAQLPLVGTSMFDTPTNIKFRSNPLDAPLNHNDMQTRHFKEGNNSSVADGISADFREALKMLTIDDDAKYKRQPLTDNRLERITDAFHRGENLLMSNDNARPKSRSKTALSINNFHKVTPTSETDLVDTNSSKSTKRLHSYISDDNMHKIFGDITTPVTFSERNNGSNNANNEAVIIKNVLKKEKRHRKRAKSTVKVKKSKQSKITIPSTGVHISLDIKHSSAPAISSPTSSPPRQRVSSEPPSKLSLSSILSCAPHSLNSNHTASKLYTSTACKVVSRDLSSAPTGTSSKYEPGNNTQNIIHFTHGSIASDASSSQNVDLSLNAQGKPVTVHKQEIYNRVKSGHSLRSIKTTSEDSIARDSIKENTSSQLDDDLSLSAKPCNFHITPKQTLSANSQRKGSGSSFSTEFVSKEAALTAIYGAVHQTANRIASQIEELKKVKKVFLSDRQSGTLKESGVEYPCAPPATPNPDLVRNYEYIPCMSDIRSQRAVKSRLQVMERDAQKKKEKKKEVQAKQEKQLVKDREKLLKAQQRREIYALNKVMTELENKRFLEFCNAKGLRT